MGKQLHDPVQGCLVQGISGKERIGSLDTLGREESYELGLLIHQRSQRISPPEGRQTSCWYLGLRVSIDLGDGDRERASKFLFNELAQWWKEVGPFGGTAQQQRGDMAGISKLVAMERDAVEQMKLERSLMGTFIVGNAFDKSFHPGSAIGIKRASSNAIELAQFRTKYFNSRVVIMHLY